jgi:phage replication-related protein YjqB (UPF0714/DUF867 family)
MSSDIYGSFLELSRNERLNQDYRITSCDRGSAVTILAPHGGWIEPKTSYIAARIANKEFNYYSFDGLKSHYNRSLHITSHKFDEPRALRLLTRSQVVVAIHACRDTKALVYPGGRDRALVLKIVRQMSAAGIPVADGYRKYPGTNPDNICNRGTSGKGVQLEVSRGLRDDMVEVKRLCAAVYRAISALRR